MTVWTDLIDGIAERLAGQAALAGFLSQIEELPRILPDVAATKPAKLPIQRFWPVAGAANSLGTLMARLDDELAIAWRQNPNYRAHPPSSGFLENYGYLEVAGPEAPVRVANLRLGVLLLGPETLYPPHHHPAEEVYLPLGPGRWSRDGAGWEDKPAGAVIHHPPMCGHATQSGREPLAALYLWRGEIGPAARID